MEKSFFFKLSQSFYIILGDHISLLEWNGRISECIKTKDSLNVTHSWWCTSITQFCFLSTWSMCLQVGGILNALAFSHLIISSFSTATTQVSLEILSVQELVQPNPPQRAVMALASWPTLLPFLLLSLQPLPSTQRGQMTKGGQNTWN